MPKYVLKFIQRDGSTTNTQVYYSKNQLIADMIESWGS